MLGPKHARREDRCPLYRTLNFFSSDRSEIGLDGALGIGYERDILAFLIFGLEGGAFEGFRGRCEGDYKSFVLKNAHTTNFVKKNAHAYILTLLTMPISIHTNKIKNHSTQDSRVVPHRGTN